MAPHRQEQIEKAVKQAIRKLLEGGEAKAPARFLSMIAKGDDEIEYGPSPRDIGQFLDQNRDLGFVTVEKRDHEHWSHEWVFHETDGNGNGDDASGPEE